MLPEPFLVCPESAICSGIREKLYSLPFIISAFVCFLFICFLPSFSFTFNSSPPLIFFLSLSWFFHLKVQKPSQYHVHSTALYVKSVWGSGLTPLPPKTKNKTPTHQSEEKVLRICNTQIITTFWIKNSVQTESWILYSKAQLYIFLLYRSWWNDFSKHS